MAGEMATRLCLLQYFRLIHQTYLYLLQNHQFKRITNLHIPRKIRRLNLKSMFSGTAFHK